MKTQLAWSNLKHNPRRTAAVVSGISFSILLIFFQLGLYEACKLNATLIYNIFNFDAVLISPYYSYMDQPGTISKRRIYQTRSYEGVESVVPLHLGKALWRNSEKDEWQWIFTMGIDCSEKPFISANLNNSLKLITDPDTILMDTHSSDIYGPRTVGIVSEINGRRVRVTGEYSQGAGFISSGTIIASNLTFCRVIKGAALEAPTLGLVKFADNINKQELVAKIRANLADDVQILSKPELEEKERHFYMNIKPLGVMFTLGTFVAFLVGAVILYQVLCTEATRHSREYATLKAMGYTSRSLKKVIMEEGLLLVIIGFGPALLLSWYLYGVLRYNVRILTYMTPGRIITVLSLSLLMACVSGLLAVKRINNTDPADLF